MLHVENPVAKPTKPLIITQLSKELRSQDSFLPMLMNRFASTGAFGSIVGFNVRLYEIFDQVGNNN